MNYEPSNPLPMGDTSRLTDFRIGELVVSPSRRIVEGPAGIQHLQPQAMAVLVCLAQQRDRVVTRRALFDTCWNGVPVGDDSLNQSISTIRTAFQASGMTDLSIETIPRSGYRLVIPPAAAGADETSRKRAVEMAFDCWRAGYPKPDAAEIAELEAALVTGGDAYSWGIFALSLRKAAEYATAAECGSYVSRCEQAARRALELDPSQADALAALAGLVPLFGNWTETRRRLLANLSLNEGHVVSRHDLAVLEMATGCGRVAVPIIAKLLDEDGLAATFHYKRMFHLWTIGDLNEAERVAVRALNLWPRHPAIWAARFWILIFTSRADQAVHFASDSDSRPPLPPVAAGFFVETARTAKSYQQGDLSPEDRSRQVSASLEVSAVGPANAILALLALCALDAIDEAFEVARGYYLGQGRTTVPLRWNSADPSITDQHRRITQPLFIPAARRMREDPRFLPLCRDMGLEAYWDEFGLVPDFLGK